MRLTTKGRFAVTAMIDVAMHGANGPVTLATVSERQRISLSYLEQLFGKLRRSGLVASVRGPGGGYLQALDAETGKPAWRFWSIARPDEFGGNSWNGLPLEQRNGGSIWTASSYDPDLNLVFFGPAPTYDTGPLAKLNKIKGVTNEWNQATTSR